jgi:hypothetical protein
MVEAVVMLLIYICLVVGVCYLVIWVLEQLGAIQLESQKLCGKWCLGRHPASVSHACASAGITVMLCPGIWVLITITVIVAALAIIGTWERPLPQ